jgi:hypothetical protein
MSPGCTIPTLVGIPDRSLSQFRVSDLPLAPDDDRADLVALPFSDPTTVTNPLFPIIHLHSVVLNGTVGDKPFRTETTLLPDTRVIGWSPGQCIRVLVSQYVAYLDGRIEEVALR